MVEWKRWYEKNETSTASFPSGESALSRYKEDRDKFERRREKERKRMHSNASGHCHPWETPKHHADKYEDEPRKHSADEPAESPTKKQR